MEAIDEQKVEAEKLNVTLETLRSATQSALEAQKRSALEAAAARKYHLQISDADLKEINEARSIATRFRDPSIIYKVLWKAYYELPFNELMVRLDLDSSESISGIYKITNLENQQSYIGQSVNLRNRLKTHIKCGLGIDAPKNKLYLSLQKYGVENFSYEILELVPRANLDAAERFWIEYYQSTSWGMNSTKGNNT